MEIITGESLAKLCDYSFGDHHVVWDKNLKGESKVANISNAEFMVKCRDFEGRVMTLFIDNIRLYGRRLEFTGPHAQADAQFISYLMQTNDLLNLCSQFPRNKFVIFTSHEDTPIDDTIKLPDNVLGVHACNALYNNERVHPFPIGLQREIGENDNRLAIMKEEVSRPFVTQEPSKLLYINCGIGRNPERLPLAKFETNEWCTTRFDKDSKFFPYDQYRAFLSELRDHKFVVCPKGHGYDTHRIWETLYMRRVPVMIKDTYFEKLLKNFPVAFVSSWDKVVKQRVESPYWNGYYEAAQNMDLSKLDLHLMFRETMKQYGI